VAEAGRKMTQKKDEIKNKYMGRNMKGTINNY
jgi:hypothetical protein